MRWRGALFGIAVVTWLFGTSVVAADPAITVSATRRDANGAVVIFVSVGPATARAPISIDSGVGTTAGRGDKIAVSIGAAFFIVAVCLIFFLLRGLPVYPIGQMTARRGREPERT